MKRAVFKKSFSLILAVVMLFTMVPATVFAADKELPVIKAFTTLTGDYHAYRTKIVTATFLDKIDTTGALYSWDVSENGDGSVMAWLTENKTESDAAGDTRYDLYIGGEGGVSANPNSNDLFFGFSVLREINGFENFDTSNVVTFKYTFQQCFALETLDLSSFDTSNVQSFLWMFTDCQALETLNLAGWDTSNATTMDSMFKNCYKLNPLDISSFDTGKVTNMANMFYKCESLKTLYVGDGWKTEQVTSSNAMFNCCYLIEGKKSYSDPEISYPHDKKYATEDYFVTYKAPEAPTEYTVTYEFIGDVIPDGVKLPDSYRYNEGSKIKVESAPTADGYVFSGWTTTDATVENGEFTVNNDVHFVGSWSKLYTVEYRYKEGYEVPEGAPALPATVQYKAGDLVDISGIPYVDRHLFIGWTTDDTDAAGDMFIMPENDVVFCGYFKIPVESVEFNNDEDIVINKDEQEKLNVYVKPEDATVKDIVYESSDESIVTVDKYGNITAVGEGTATVTVFAKDDPTKSDTITVTVKIPVDEIGVEKSDITLKPDGKDKIEVQVNEDATNKEVTFESSDETVVKVDENGNVEAVGEGTATITVTSKDNSDMKVTVTVTVKNPVTELTVGEDFTLEIDETKNVDAKVNADATDKTLIYDTSDPGVVKVDSNGDVIAVGEGTATITVKSKDNPDLVETVTVTVVKKYKVTYAFVGDVIPEGVVAPAEKRYNNGTEVSVEAEAFVEGYTFSGWTTEDTVVTDGEFVIRNDVHFVGSFSKDVKDIVVEKNEFELEIGDKDKIEATVTPDDATEKGVTYESSDETIVKVDENGNIEAVGEGTVTITVKSKADDKITETVTVTVTKPEIPVKDIVVEKNEFELEIGDKDKIEATVTPDDATEKGVTYESSDETIVKVDENGNIEAVGEGTVTITVKSKADDKITETVTVTVTKPEVPVKDIVVEKNEFELEIGDKDKIEATVTPDDATEKGVTYESSDETIVKVDENGNIEAVGEGTVTITVKSKDNDKITETVTVTVTRPEEPSEPDVPDEPEEPEYVITVPEIITLYAGETKNLGVTITPDDGKIKPVYTSGNTSIATVDADGNVKALKTGAITVSVDLGNGDVRIVTVRVLAAPVITPAKTHHVCFGKTDGIGWYEVSVNGGDFFPQGPNSTLEVPEGAVLVVRVQDMWIDDEFDFYVNGSKVPMDPANTITVVVDGYMLIGALSMDIEVPDVEESLSILDKIKNFFIDIINWFKNLFKK